MQNALTFWTGLDRRRQLVLAVVTVTIFLAVLSLARLSTSSPMALLYAGLDPAGAGQLVAALDQRGLAYEVRGDAIWVEESQRDQLRMSLAGEGLPATGAAGYELLDQLSGFGTTAQMFDAAFLRAKEGELARSIAANPAIRAARVHLAVQAGQPFQTRQPATASVTVTLRSGPLTARQAQAIRHLVAAAVPGLASQDVALIDSAAGLIAVEDDATGLSGEGRSQALKRSVERLLSAKVGLGRAMVELTLDIEKDRESIRERKFDPQGRVAISTDSESRSNSSSDTPLGVTVASNLPEGDASEDQRQNSQAAESRERVNYEVSETAREFLREPGGIRRLSVAVLVDGLIGDDGVWVPRPEAELEDLHALVASAVGFDEARGDVITIRSMRFEGPLALDAGPSPPWFASLDAMQLIQLAVILIVVLALSLFVLRPILMTARAAQRQEGRGAPMLLVPGPTLEDTAAAPTGVGAMEVLEADEALPADPVARLRELIARRQGDSIEVLRAWMDDPDGGRR